MLRRLIYFLITIIPPCVVFKITENPVSTILTLGASTFCVSFLILLSFSD